MLVKPDRTVAFPEILLESGTSGLTEDTTAAEILNIIYDKKGRSSDRPYSPID